MTGYRKQNDINADLKDAGHKIVDWIYLTMDGVQLYGNSTGQ